MMNSKWLRGTVASILFSVPALMFGDDVLKIPTAEALAAVVSKVPPAYPPMAKQLHVEGAVDMQVSISDSGNVDEVSTLSGNPILAAAATDALKKWKFTPFKSAGKNVKAVTSINLNFKL